MPLTLNFILVILSLVCPVLVYITLLSQPPGIHWGSAAAAFGLVFFYTLYVWACYRKRLMRILLDECDPERFIWYCRRTAEYPLASQYGQAVNQTRLLYAMGLKEAGRFEEAAGMLSSVKSLPKSPKGELSEIIRRCQKAELLMRFNDKEKAREDYEPVKQKAESLAVRKPRWRSMLNDITDEYDNMLNAADGNDDRAKLYYKSKFDSAKNAYSRVSAKYNLGLLYARCGQTDKAIKALQYTADNANKLYIAEEAKRLLAELSQSV